MSSSEAQYSYYSTKQWAANHFMLKICIISDIYFAFGVLLKESLPGLKRQRQHSNAKSFLVLQWLICGYILSLSYSSTLFSMMMMIKYDDTIDNLNDMDKSGLPLLVLEGAPTEQLTISDPRPIIRRILNVAKPKMEEEDKESLATIVQWFIYQ